MLAENVNRALPGFQEGEVCSSELLLLSLRRHRIAMVQPAESRKGLNLAFTRRANFCCTTCWRVRGSRAGRKKSVGQPLLDGIWISRGSPDPSRDTPFREIETQFEQFAVNARRSPGRILGNHLKDQCANLFADTLPPSYSSES